MKNDKMKKVRNMVTHNMIKRLELVYTIRTHLDTIFQQ